MKQVNWMDSANWVGWKGHVSWMDVEMSELKRLDVSSKLDKLGVMGDKDGLMDQVDERVKSGLSKYFFSKNILIVELSLKRFLKN